MFGGTLVISSGALRFPLTGALANPTTRTLTIKNAGQGVLNGLIDLDKIAPPFMATQASGFSLSHGQPASVTIQFAPTIAGKFKGSFKILSSDPNAPDAIVTVLGDGAPPRLSAPKVVNFGAVRLNKSKTLTITIRNLGLGVLEGNIDTDGLTVAIGPNEFSASPGNPAFTIPHRGVQRLKVKFTPTTRPRMDGLIVITSNDPKHPSFTITVRGSGR